MPWIGIVATFAMCCLFFLRADLRAGSVPRNTSPRRHLCGAALDRPARQKSQALLGRAEPKTQETHELDRPWPALAPRLLAMIRSYVSCVTPVAGDRLVELSSCFCSSLIDEASGQ